MPGKGTNGTVSGLGNPIGLNFSTHFLRQTANTPALELGEPLQKVQSHARHAYANHTLPLLSQPTALRKSPADSLPLI